MSKTVRFKPTKILQQVWNKGDGSQEIVEMVNTKKHQLASVDLFALQLGYYSTGLQEGSSFTCIRGLYPRGKMKVVSFNTMIRWHNTGFMPHYHHGLAQELPNQAERLGLDANAMMRAINARLYKQVFLHGRRDKTVSCYKHVLKFA